MTAPCEPEATPDPSEEEQEIILRLSDILPRVPVHLLKPGPHDTTLPVRFSIEELAEKIARGRVSVPLQRLASACPDVFRVGTPFLAQEEISLPLQKLLEQVGLAIPKPSAANGIPSDQLVQARAQASRILEANAPPRPPEPQTLPSAHSFRIAKAISTARQILGVFARPNESAAPGDTVAGKPAETKPSAEEIRAPSDAEVKSLPAEETQPSSAAETQPPAVIEAGPEPLAPANPEFPEEPSPEAAVESSAAVAGIPSNAESGPDPAAKNDAPPKVQGTPALAVEQAAPPVPEGYIPLHALPIFRLLPAQVLRSGTMPPVDARVALPLAAIDPQLAGGHVEIPLEDFMKALPQELREGLNSIPETQVWIPLDEIFQNLPPDHLFYMPPLITGESPSIENVGEGKGGGPLPDAEAVEPVETVQALAGKPKPEPASDQPVSPAAPSNEAAPTVDEGLPQPPPADQEIVSEVAAAPPSAESVPTMSEPVSPDTEAVPETAVPPPSAESALGPSAPEMVAPAPESAPEATASIAPAEGVSTSPAPQTSVPSQEEKAEIAPQSAPSLPPEPNSAESVPVPAAAPLAELPAAPPASRAPWTRGFQVPPPRLFSGGTFLVDPVSPAAPVEQVSTPAATPEAKHTADFLASQPGIFASAAFVQGAVFASADFPRKPDLDALRDFMGAFIESARENGRRLGWNRVLTLACEQFHLTAVVRDSHFIVALHHDRVLALGTYEALIAAADDLSKAAG